MKIILFDLGQTLEDNGLIAGCEMLSAIQGMKYFEEKSPAVALVSDYYVADNPEGIETLKKQYYKILEKLGIQPYFQPLSQMVTLSTEVGVRKPDKIIFRNAIDKIQRDLPFHQSPFITENFDHVANSPKAGMTAIRFKGPGQNSGEVSKLVDLIPVIRRLLDSTPCGKKRNEAVGLHQPK